MRKRNWLAEDNLVALYVALHKYENLDYDAKEIRRIIPHKGFLMRIQNYKAIDTNGKQGLNAGLKSPTFRKLHSLFKQFSQKRFAELVNLILTAKSTVAFFATVQTDGGRKVERKNAGQRTINSPCIVLNRSVFGKGGKVENCNYN